MFSGTGLDPMSRARQKVSETGKFDLGDGNQLDGELKLAGRQTSLYLRSMQFFHPSASPSAYIRGYLNDFTKVSLIDCISPGTGTISREDGRSYFAKVFPHFVLTGDQYLAPHEEVVSSADFVIDDATTLFYDFDAFGSVIDARPLIKQVVLANKLDRDIPTGDYPQIHYFTGKQQIFCTETPIGRVSAYHSPSWTFPGPYGIRVENKIRVMVEFADCVQFKHAINQIFLLRNFLGLLLGRPQKLSEIRIQLKNTGDYPVFLGLHWSWCPTRNKSTHGERPHPSDVLVDAVRQPEEFSNVLAKWLERHSTWHDARQRFFEVYARGRTYNIDRLIGAANMFDILPPSAVPAEAPLNEEILAAKAEAKRLFKKLDPSPERDSLLGALGRLGKATLKRKVRSRADVILKAMPHRFPDLTAVIDQAVDCRNYFVHGGEPRINYIEDELIIWFFADTLEFVFAASDLIEDGWDIEAWAARSSVSHPFGRYVKNYAWQMGKLKRLTDHLNSTAGTPSLE